MKLTQPELFEIGKFKQIGIALSFLLCIASGAWVTYYTNDDLRLLSHHLGGHRNHHGHHGHHHHLQLVGASGDLPPLLWLASTNSSCGCLTQVRHQCDIGNVLLVNLIIITSFNCPA